MFPASWPRLVILVKFVAPRPYRSTFGLSCSTRVSIDVLHASHFMAQVTAVHRPPDTAFVGYAKTTAEVGLPESCPRSVD